MTLKLPQSDVRALLKMARVASDVPSLRAVLLELISLLHIYNDED
jgi:hypothetical protein